MMGTAWCRPSPFIVRIGWFLPTSESWAAGDREVICFGYHVDFEKITGSINGIGQ